MLLEALKILAPRGRIIEISAGQNPNITLNLRDFYHQQARLIGVDSLSLDSVQCAQILRDLSPGFASGELTPPPIAATYPLDQAIQAYEAVEAGRGVSGRHAVGLQRLKHHRPPLPFSNGNDSFPAGGYSAHINSRLRADREVDHLPGR